MEKTDFDRYSLNENLLKEILIRIDYKGVIDIKEFVKKHAEHIKQYFQQYDLVENKNVNIELDFQQMSELLSIPIKEIESQQIHRFTQNKFPDCSDTVRLDISQYYTILNIKCNKYKNIDPYQHFIDDLINKLRSDIEFINIRRIGIRKVGGDIFRSIESIWNIYEPKFFNYLYTENIISQQSLHFDVLHFTDPLEPEINFKRLIQKGVQKKEDGTPIEAFKVILDMDGYFEADKINTHFLIEKKDKSIFELINDKLFEVFKMSVKLNYLNEHGHIEH